MFTHNRSLRTLLAVFVPVAIAAGPVAAADHDQAPVADGQAPRVHDHESALVWVEQLAPVTATLRADGSQVEYESSAVWKPICGSDAAQFTLDDLKATARDMRAALERNAGNMIVLNQSRPRAGLDIIFNIIPPDGTWQSPPAGAVNALADVEAYVESQFDDTVTMPIDIGFRSLGAGILGSTSSNFVNSVPWTTARNALVADMDANDLLQLFLPAGTIPVYYDANTSTITNQAVVNFTRANYNASVGTVGGSAATISISTNFSFDYDPSNGVVLSQTDFQSVMVHEVGHMLGFVSRADAQINSTMHILDVYRFQNTDGANNRNPDTISNFFNDPRTVDFDMPNDDANTDLILNEFRMEDGNPRQASHFRDSFPAHCIMDPTISNGFTFWPDFYRDCDLVAFDAIGWDRTGTLEPPLEAPYPHDRPKNRYISFSPNPANAGVQVAYFVYVQQITAGSCDGNGGRCRLDHGNDDCNVCSLSGTPCISAAVDCPAGQSCVSTGDTCVNDLFLTNFGYEGRSWWVGQPDANGIARLVSQDDRYFSNNWPATIHVGDCEIVPRTTYSIQAFDSTELSAGALLVSTADRPSPNYWADCVGQLDFYCDGDTRNAICDPQNNNCPLAQPCVAAYPPPDGVINFGDVAAAVAKFAGLPGAALPHVTWVDVHGDNGNDASVDPPNLVVNFSDIDFMVKAFQGRPYPFVDPAVCPDSP